MKKRDSRLRRAKTTRMKIRVLDTVRLCVHRTPKHIYAQITTSDGKSVITSASTLDKKIKSDLKSTGNTLAAKAVGKLLAERALDKGINNVAFDRSGYRYHGRIKALADAARETGLQF